MTVTTRTHYEVLGIAPDATEQDVKAAYRKLAKAFHPDMASGSQALFGMVAEAYEVLSKPDRRAAYDRDLNPSTTSAQQSADASAAGSDQTRHGAGSTSRTTGASGGTGTKASHGPFGRAYAAADNGEGYTYRSPFTGRYRRAAAAAASARAKVPVDPGRGNSIAWWAFPAVVATTFGFGLLRYTGLTGWLVGARVGDPVIFGVRWDGTPVLFSDGLDASVQATVMVLALCAALTAGFWWRKQQAPMARTEKGLLLGVLAVVAGFGEFLLVAPVAWLATLGAVLAYAAWVRMLRGLPRPGSTEQWESFSMWVRAVLEHRARIRAARAAARRHRVAQFRAGLRRTFHVR